MTDIEVLLANWTQLAVRLGSSLLFLWGIYFFFKNLFGENGRHVGKIVVSVLTIILAAAAFKIIPTLISVGENTGQQTTGGGGSYSSMSTLPATNTATAIDTHLATTAA